MKKQKILFLLGVWIAILSFLGFPSGIKTTLFVLTGLVLILISYNLNKKNGDEVKMEKENSEQMHPFIDNIENN